jgi:hypothetical protein
MHKSNLITYAGSPVYFERFIMEITAETMNMIHEGLCVYDPLSPSYFDGIGKKDNCYCDSCFHGTAQLSELILELLKERARNAKHNTNSRKA